MISFSFQKDRLITVVRWESRWNLAASQVRDCKASVTQLGWVRGEPQ